MDQIRVLQEEASARGWAFQVAVRHEAARESIHRITLSWADYDLWSPGGSDPPARVVEAAVRFLIDHLGGETLPASFDASIARRRVAGADQSIPRMISGE